MTDKKVNFNFEESYLGEKQIVVTNNLGRTVKHLELVSLDGYFGECREFDGIVTTAKGLINIDSDREIRTNQINTDDTFTLGSVVYFVPGGSSAAGVLRAQTEATAIAVGICTFINAGVAIGFRPFVQRLSEPNIVDVVYNSDAVKVTTVVVDDDATTAIDISDKIPIGARIIDVIVKATATAAAAGTLTLRSAAAAPANISGAIDCDTDKEINRAAALENDIVDDDGLEVVAAAADNRGVMSIFWR